MTCGADGLRLREIQAATLFDLAESGRLVEGSSPDRPVAPRLWIAGSAAGNVVRCRVDVGAAAAQAIEALVAHEPPMRAEHHAPRHLDDDVQILEAEAAVEDVSRELTYVFPATMRHWHEGPVVRSHTVEGLQLLEQLEASGMPEAFAAMGFGDARDLWPPWCIALEGDAVAAIAFAARLSPLAAEVGVATAPAFRRRGLAAAAAAEWASLPELDDRTLFYSADAENVSSQHVAERLGLALLGPSLSIR
jgi:RimJ/RimL family protein N-acetyltransferase